MQQQLTHRDQVNVLSAPGETSFHHGFFSDTESDVYMKYLLNEVSWMQEPIVMFGKTLMQPRLTAFYGDPGMEYTYSGLTLSAKDWTDPLLKIKEKIENKCGTVFNVCLLNYYRDGKDHMGWHRDNERSLGQVPVIASLSFGGTRIFQFRKYEEKMPVISLELDHGSLVLMKGETQKYWEHRVTKTTLPVGPRINLTFRSVKMI